MAEAHQADIADQQVEGAGEQREAQRLHQEHRIDEERRDQQRRDQQQDRSTALSGGDVDAGPGRRMVRRRSRAEQAGRPDQQHDRHDDEDHRVGGRRIEHLGQALDAGRARSR